LKALVIKLPPPLLQLLVLMEEVFGLKDLSDGAQSNEVYRIFRKNSEDLLHFYPQERSQFLDALLDGLYYLAQVADQDGKTLLSMDFAQMTMIVMQLLSWDKSDPEADENRLCRFEQHEQNYSWIEPPVEGPLDMEIIFHYLAFAGTATIADLKFFTNSRELFAQKQVSNHLWTAVWRGLCRQRKSVAIAYAIRCQLNEMQGDLEYLTTLLEQGLKQYTKCLAEFGAAVQSTVVQDKSFSNYFMCFDGNSEEKKQMFLNKELNLTMKLAGFITTHGFDQSAQAILLELVTYLNEEKD
jgi:hypothetical protein